MDQLDEQMSDAELAAFADGSLAPSIHRPAP
jgi:hypothetical protein